MSLLPNAGRRALHSPVLLFCLLLFIGVLSVALQRAHAAQRPPGIDGYDWARHPEAIIVVYPLADSCSSCNLSASGWAELGFEHNLDVLILAARDHADLKTLRRSEARNSRLSIFTTVSPDVIQQFSSGDKIGGVRIHQARIVARQVGGTPSLYFLSLKGGEK